MRNQKLFIALASLSATEFQAFHSFLKTDFFHPGPKPRIYLKTIAPFYPDFTAEELTESFIFKAVSPGIPYNQQRFREETARLFALLKKFLAYQEFQSRPKQEELWALTQFRKRRLEKAFQTQWKSIQKSLDSAPIKDADHYQLQSELAYEANGFFGNKQIRTIDHNLQDGIDNLDVFYLIRKLRESCEILNRKHILNADYQLRMMDEIILYLNSNGQNMLEIPAIRIYYQIFLMYSQTEEEAHYEALVELLARFHTQFSKEEARGMYKYVQNYCIRQINQGNSIYLQKLFKLYQAELENGIIYSNGLLAHTDFKNISTVGLRVAEFEWVHNFLHRYQNRVSEPFRMNVFNYCLASWYLEKGNYFQAIRLLQKVTFTDLQYQISARYLLIKAYYETEEWDSLIYLIKAFLNFIRRNKGISTGNRSNHRNFLQILQLMVRLRMRKSFLDKEEFDKRYEKIEERLKENERVPHLKWLQEKLENLFY